jgi:hypothetical protein
VIKTITVLGAIVIVSLVLQPMADRKGFGKLLAVFRAWVIVSLVALWLFEKL